VDAIRRPVRTLSAIVIVEPNAVLGESLKHYLEHKGFRVTRVVDSARAVSSLDDTSDETAVLLNGARGDIVADFTLLRALGSKARIIVYGGRSELKATIEAIQSGATVYLDDKVNAPMFLKSLELAAHGFVTMAVTVHGDTVQPPGEADEATAIEVWPPAPGSAASSQATSRAAPTPQASNLAPDLVVGRVAPTFSPREASILQLLRQGAPNKLIARQLSLTEATVKVHLKSILRKIGVNNRTQAAVWAMAQEAFFHQLAEQAAGNADGLDGAAPDAMPACG
jgi:two-component system nitrate/nitrite response regulator NarL